MSEPLDAVKFTHVTEPLDTVKFTHVTEPLDAVKSTHVTEPIEEIKSESEWSSWQDPLVILIKEVTKWLEELPLTLVSREADHKTIRSRSTRLIHTLGRSLSEDAEPEPIEKVLSLYVYQTDVWADAFKAIFEYIGENEHQYVLNSSEFANTKQELIADFSLYAQYW